MCNRPPFALCLLSVFASFAASDQQAQAPAKTEPPAYALARKGTATVEDAYRQFAALATGQGRLTIKGNLSDASFAEVTAHLEALGILDTSWKFDAACGLRRDVLAYMCTSYMGYRPGLITGMCGMTRRYAHREMLRRGVLPPGMPNVVVSGADLLAVISTVAERTNPNPDVLLDQNELH